MIINISNRTEFVNKFLVPISRINNTCSLKLTSNSLTGLVSTQDASVILDSKFAIECDVEDDVYLNIPDIGKLIRVLECIQEDDVSLKLNNNNISYNKSGIRFKYHLLEDGIISTPKINIEKVKTLNYDTKFVITGNTFSQLMKGASFACDTNKVYLSSSEGRIYSELTDKTKSNVDSIQTILSDEFEGVEIESPIPLNFEIMRIVSCNKYDKVQVWLNIDLSVMVFILKSESIEMHYVASGLAEA